MARKVEFSISVIIILENCAWGKSGKNSEYKIYLMKCTQKCKFLKIQHTENKLKSKNVPSYKKVKISNIQMGNFLENS